MSQGIYCYIDIIKNKIVYIGKDSYIDENRRHKAHLYQCNYDSQRINRILQKNPNRYKYVVLEEGNFSLKLLNALEQSFIQKYNPKFNFTKGGEGLLGYKMTDEHKNNISKGKKGKSFSDIHKKRLSEAAKGNCNHLGKLCSTETKKKISYTKSKNQNTVGYYRVYKIKLRNGFGFAYRYYDEKGVRHKISSKSLKILEEKVKSRGLEWFKL